MKKLICILLAAATAAGCEKDDPTRYDMSQGRVCFPGAAPNETAEYPGYSNSDSTFYASMTFKQQPEGVAEAVIEVPGSILLNYACMKFLVEVCGLWPTPSKCITSLAVALYSYLAARYYTFKGISSVK